MIDTDRQTQTQIDRLIDRHNYRDRERAAGEGGREIETDVERGVGERGIDRQTERLIDRQTDSQTD